MIVVAGWLRTARGRREAFLASCRDDVLAARSAPGCHVFSLSPDLLDDDVVQVLERWEDEASLIAFRGRGASEDEMSDVVDAEVRRYVVTDEGPA